MKKKSLLIGTILLLFLLTACSGNDGSFTVTKENGEKNHYQLLDVWKSPEGKIMVSLSGTQKGTLCANTVYGYPQLYEKVQIFSDGQWLESKDYPKGMSASADGGSITIRYPVEEMPTQIKVSETVLSLEKIKLPGVDREGLLLAEEKALTAEENKEQDNEKEQRKLAEKAEEIAPKGQGDDAWIKAEKTQSGEKLYYGVTGLEKAEYVQVAFVVSADGKEISNVKVIGERMTLNGNTYQKKEITSYMAYPVKEGKVTIDTGDVFLDLSISEEMATGVFQLKEVTEKNRIEKNVESYGVAKITLRKIEP
ncbi:MAG: hypothetical protein GX786_06455 [Clostridiales bacterium]|nr:hypothetical protein [Clostridiales bacterium]